LYGSSAVLLEWLPFLLAACVGRRFGGVLRVSASLSLGRIIYRRRSFNMAEGAGGDCAKKRTLNSSICKQPISS
jgi:hypothetical protein